MSAKDKLIVKILMFIARMLTSNDDLKKELESLANSLQYNCDERSS